MWYDMIRVPEGVLVKDGFTMRKIQLISSFTATFRYPGAM